MTEYQKLLALEILLALLSSHLLSKPLFAETIWVDAGGDSDDGGLL